MRYFEELLFKKSWHDMGRRKIRPGVHFWGPFLHLTSLATLKPQLKLPYNTFFEILQVLFQLNRSSTRPENTNWSPSVCTCGAAFTRTVKKSKVWRLGADNTLLCCETHSFLLFAKYLDTNKFQIQRAAHWPSTEWLCASFWHVSQTDGSASRVWRVRFQPERQLSNKELTN